MSDEEGLLGRVEGAEEDLIAHGPRSRGRRPVGRPVAREPRREAAAAGDERAARRTGGRGPAVPRDRGARGRGARGRSGDAGPAAGAAGPAGDGRGAAARASDARREAGRDTRRRLRSAEPRGPGGALAGPRARAVRRDAREAVSARPPAAHPARAPWEALGEPPAPGPRPGVAPESIRLLLQTRGASASRGMGWDPTRIWGIRRNLWNLRHRVPRRTVPAQR